MQEKSAAYINEHFDEIRRKNIKNYITNCYTGLADRAGVGTRPFLFAENENSCLCLKPDRDIYRLYYASQGYEGLEELFKELPEDKKISLEYLSKTPIPEPLEEIFKKHLLYDTTFVRSICDLEKVRIFNFSDKGEIAIAKEEDAPEIERIFNETFSHHDAHLPDRDELLLRIKNGCVLLFKRPNIIAITTYKERRKIIDFDLTLSRDKDIKTLLMILNYTHLHFKEINASKYISWVNNEKNTRLQQVYEHFFKFKQDGLKNIIYVNKLLMEDVLKYRLV